MKKEKRHISTKMKLIIGIVVAILVCLVLVYIYNNYLVGLSFKDNIVLFSIGIIVMLMTFVSVIATLALIGCLFATLVVNYDAKKSYLKSKEQIKALPSNFVNVHFKDFNNFRLACFVDSEDITCFAKLDENGNVVYAFLLNVEYETDDYETFLKHFDI